MQQGIQEMDIYEDNQNTLEESSIKAQHINTKNCLEILKPKKTTYLNGINKVNGLVPVLGGT